MTHNFNAKTLATVAMMGLLAVGVSACQSKPQTSSSTTSAQKTNCNTQSSCSAKTSCRANHTGTGK